MLRHIRFVALAFLVTASPALAHHDGKGSLGSVNITQPVLVGGMILLPGVYEVRDTGEHAKPLPGQGADAQAYVEFVQNGMVVARDIAEIMTDEARPVGTSGAASGATTARMRFEQLKGGDFARISVSRGADRYLIHLPVKQDTAR
jgi:hypothetical protein